MPEKRDPDLILLDLVMPIMDGLDVLRIIKKDLDLKQIHIIGVSASISQNKRKQEFETLCDGFVGKPISIDILLEKIRITLGLTWKVISPPQPIQPSKISTERENLIILPPDYALNHITTIVQQGMFNKLKDILRDLEDGDSRYAPFCRQIQKYSSNYDDERIITYITRLKRRRDYNEG